MSSIVSKGKDVKEAIKFAIRALDTTNDEIDVEILDPGKKKVFGLIKKPAVVKVTRKTVGKSNYLKEEEQGKSTILLNEVKSAINKVQKETLKGKAWIRDGIISCKDDQNAYPVIQVPPNIKLYCNDKEVKGKMVIMESDDLKYEIHERIIDTAWNLNLNSQLLNVKINISPGKRITGRLADQDPACVLKMKVIEEIEITNTLSKEAVLEELKNVGVVHGINFSEIEKACETLHEGEYTIARAQLPSEGVDGYFDCKVNVEEFRIQPKEQDNGTVNYRELKDIPIIEAGEVIGCVIPAVPGKPGIDVKGHPILPKQVKALLLRLADGVTLVHDHTVIATNSGRPKVETQGHMVRISVVPKLYHDASVDISSGNIHFIGDVEITGSVEEYMEVTADGDIIIHDYVSGARVFSGNSLYIGNNVIASDIRAGQSNLIISELGQLSGEIIEQILNIEYALEQICQNIALKENNFITMGFSSLLRVLLEQKFKSFLPLIQRFILTVKMGKDHLDIEWIELSELCSKKFSITHPEHIRDVRDLQAIQTKLEYLHRVSIHPSEPNVILKVNYTMNSQLFSSGDIYIEEGCYNSKIHASGKVCVNGYVMGGEIYANGGVKIEEVGSKVGIRTKITVPSTETITIGVAKEDTRIQIGKAIYQFAKDTHNVVARIENGEIQLER